MNFDHAFLWSRKRQQTIPTIEAIRMNTWREERVRGSDNESCGGP